MNLLQKFKETASSVLPVMAIVLILGVTAAPLGSDLLLRFFVGGILLITGLTIFLLGVDVGILPLGEQGGSELTKRRNLPLLLGASFLIGFLVTASEPDIQVLADQVRSVFPLVNKLLFIVMIAIGVGLYIMLGLLRTVMHLSLKIILAVSYVVIFILAFAAPQSFIGIAFDSGGATTGPMTVPFIMALGIGVSSVRMHSKGGTSDSQSDNFGLTGMASAGPIMAVLLYGSVLSHHARTVSEAAASGAGGEAVQGLRAFIAVLPHIVREAAFSLLPVVALFVVFQIFLLRMPPRKVARMIAGFIYSYIGLVVFLVGVNGGFMAAGRKLGELLGMRAVQSGGLWTALLIGTGLLIGRRVCRARRVGAHRSGRIDFRRYDKAKSASRLFVGGCGHRDRAFDGAGAHRIQYHVHPRPRLCGGFYIDALLSEAFYRHRLRFGGRRVGAHKFDLCTFVCARRIAGIGRQSGRVRRDCAHRDDAAYRDPSVRPRISA